MQDIWLQRQGSTSWAPLLLPLDSVNEVAKGPIMARWGGGWALKL